MQHAVIMEDEPDHALVLEDMLYANGYIAHTVAFPEAAMARIEAVGARLLVTDIFVRVDGELVPQGGLSLLGSVRIARSQRRAPFVDLKAIAVTGGNYIAGGFDPLRLARQFGAHAALRKPLDLAQFEQVFAILMSGTAPTDDALLFPQLDESRASIPLRGPSHRTASGEC